MTMIILVYRDGRTLKKITALSAVQKRLFEVFGLGKYTRLPTIMPLRN